MTRILSPLSVFLSALVLLACAGAASADTLLVERVQQEARTQMPVRGTSMSQVEARFGVPNQKLDPRGGQKHQWPTINRWVYPGFTVYFENNRVVDAVVNKASADETGPMPAIR